MDANDPVSIIELQEPLQRIGTWWNTGSNLGSKELIVNEAKYCLAQTPTLTNRIQDDSIRLHMLVLLAFR